ncbi:MAG: 2-phosphosulfolactate phosphatase [Ignavibacteriales bacterium]|nr:2-phosphosulfolactate phosphatase [Ignavibacteriales bacterium]
MKATNQNHIEVHFTPASVDEESLTGKNVVVIDVLRSASTIVVALTNGAREIIPVGDMESGYKVFSNLTREVTLRCGERNGKMIEGFDLGNSPLTFTEEKVKGKSIVMLTTNGTAAMVKARYAKNLLVASFVNLTSVVNLIKSWNSDVVIVCSGQDNNFSLEDTICAGKIVAELLLENEKLLLDDSARSAVALDKTFGTNVLKMMKHSDHGKQLSEIGFEEDLQFCAQLDTFNSVPMLSSGVIKLNSDAQQSTLKKAS